MLRKKINSSFGNSPMSPALEEAETGMLTVRSSKAGDMGEFPKEEFIGMLRKEIETKAL